MKAAKEDEAVSFNSILKNSPSIIAIITFIFGTIILGLFKYVSFVADKRYLEEFHISSQFIPLGVSEAILVGVAYLGILLLSLSTACFYAYGAKHQYESCIILSYALMSCLVVFSIVFFYQTGMRQAILVPVGVGSVLVIYHIKARNGKKDSTSKKEDRRIDKENSKTIDEVQAKTGENTDNTASETKEEKNKYNSEVYQHTGEVTDANQPKKQIDNWVILVTTVIICILIPIMLIFPSVNFNKSIKFGDCVIPYNGKNYIVIYKTDKLLITEEIEYNNGTYMIYYDRQKIFDSFAMEMEYWDIGDNFKPTTVSNMPDHDGVTTETNTTEADLSESNTNNNHMT